MNFPDADLHLLDVDEFLQKRDYQYRVDMLHISPPCQVWSPAHTIPGSKDEENIAVLFSCTHLVEKIRPRVFTLEQTFGILHSRFEPYFNALVHGFTEHSYSLRWKIVHLATWGLPQVRKRLIMIGACPGERLPPFPDATHSNDPADGLKPFVTVREALSVITARTTLHNPDGASACDKPPWDPDRILPRTITTSGGQNYHWSGTRELTLREFACLQGFPTKHRFVAPSIKKQIGNAFPPCVVKVLYDHLRRCLEREDGLEPSRDRYSSPPRRAGRQWDDDDDVTIIADGSAADPVTVDDEESFVPRGWQGRWDEPFWYRNHQFVERQQQQGETVSVSSGDEMEVDCDDPQQVIVIPDNDDEDEDMWELESTRVIGDYEPPETIEVE